MEHDMLSDPITKDVNALQNNLRNGLHYCFCDHSKCISAFCKHKDKDTAGNTI